MLGVWVKARRGHKIWQTLRVNMEKVKTVLRNAKAERDI